MKTNLKFKNILSTAIIALSIGASAQQSYTFTNCSNIGPNGPTQAQVNSAYLLTNLNGSVNIGIAGIQQFTIPVSGGYRIEAYGGQGYGASGVGGRGAYMSGDFNFTAGQVIKILVGQQGELPTNVSYNAQYGGGGGSFVTDLLNVPYVVAGGGGANWSSSFSAISDAPITTSGNNGAGAGSTGSSGGSAGGGGGTANSADGGGGFNSNGSGSSPGYSYISGGVGGFVTYGIGGFGGGGGTSSYNNRRAGGGGGYSGGGAAEGVTTGFPEAGGGGSINNGANQTNSVGVNIGHGRVIITELCNFNVGSSANPICIGSAVTLTTNATGTLSWSTGGTASNVVVTPSITTSYTITGGGTGTNVCNAYRIITVTVQPLPVLSTIVTPTLICVGGGASVAASGASTYTYSSGALTNTAFLNPTVNTNYSVTGSSIYGCINSTTFSVKVNTNSLTISASSSSICLGNTATLTASGVNSFTWSNGSHFQSNPVSPTTNSLYLVNGRDQYYCLLSNSINISVQGVPNVGLSVDRNLICKGETGTLTANGASTYSWVGIGSGNVQVINFLIDIPYTYVVVGTDVNGCVSSSTLTVNVSKCTGLGENINSDNIFIYPNPAKDLITLNVNENQISGFELIDLTGKILISKNSSDAKNTINLHQFSNGIYFLKINLNNQTKWIKVVKD